MPFSKKLKRKLELQWQITLIREIPLKNNPTSGRPPPSSSNGPSSISSTSGTGTSSEIRQSASLADPFRADIWRLPDDPLTVSVFGFKISSCLNLPLTKENHKCTRSLLNPLGNIKKEFLILIEVATLVVHHTCIK